MTDIKGDSKIARGSNYYVIQLTYEITADGKAVDAKFVKLVSTSLYPTQNMALDYTKANLGGTKPKDIKILISGCIEAHALKYAQNSPLFEPASGGGAP